MFKEYVVEENRDDIWSVEHLDIGAMEDDGFIIGAGSPDEKSVTFTRAGSREANDFTDTVHPVFVREDSLRYVGAIRQCWHGGLHSGFPYFVEETKCSE